MDGNMASKLAALLRGAVGRACGTSNVVGVLFSGGLDSSIIAKLASRFSKTITLYCAGAEGAEDVLFSREMSERLGMPLRTATFTHEEAKKAVAELSGKIGNDRMQLGIALPVYFATRLAMEDGLKFALSGGGADELYGGYARYLKVPTGALNEVLRSDVAAMKDKDLNRDSAASFIEVRYPFLDQDVVEFSLSVIPGGMKVSRGERKVVLREAGRQLGLPVEITGRKKKACQYGSGADKIVGKILARKE